MPEIRSKPLNRVLVSSCLLGRRVRYNGSDKLDGHPVLLRWHAEGRIVALCPEVAVGFPTPRPPAEIADGAGGEAVLDGRGRILEATGRDVSALYRDAAELALHLAEREGCRHAVLTDGSPSCGSSFVYDGTFSGIRMSGRGATAALLERNGIRVFAETAIADLDRLLAAIEAGGDPASAAGQG